MKIKVLIIFLLRIFDNCKENIKCIAFHSQSIISFYQKNHFFDSIRLIVSVDFLFVMNYEVIYAH